MLVHLIINNPIVRSLIMTINTNRNLLIPICLLNINKIPSNLYKINLNNNQIPNLTSIIIIVSIWYKIFLFFNEIVLIYCFLKFRNLRIQVLRNKNNLNNQITRIYTTHNPTAKNNKTQVIMQYREILSKT